jgi:DNA-binding transcriptional MerR regulator
MPRTETMPRWLTHDELVERVRGRGISLTIPTFDYYRNIGVLPRPVRRRYRGATRPVYPEWMVEAVEHLKQLQWDGKSLEECKPLMREFVKNESMQTESVLCPCCGGTGRTTEVQP